MPNDDSYYYIYKRCTIKQNVFTSKSYKREKKRANFNVLLKNDRVFEVHKFIGVKSNTGVQNFIIGNYYETKKTSFIENRKLNHLMHLNKKNPCLRAVNIDEIVKKVTIIRTSQEKN